MSTRSGTMFSILAPIVGLFGHYSHHTSIKLRDIDCGASAIEIQDLPDARNTRPITSLLLISGAI